MLFAEGVAPCVPMGDIALAANRSVVADRRLENVKDATDMISVFRARSGLRSVERVCCRYDLESIF